MDQDALERLLQKFDRNASALQQDIEIAEEAMNVSLPVGYKKFLLFANGGEGFIGSSQRSGYAMLWKVEELRQFNIDYQVHKFAPGLLLFGSDGGGEAFAFDLRDPSLPIVMVPFITMEEEAFRFMGKTFDEFLFCLDRYLDFVAGL